MQRGDLPACRDRKYGNEFHRGTSRLEDRVSSSLWVPTLAEWVFATGRRGRVVWVGGSGEGGKKGSAARKSEVKSVSEKDREGFDMGVSSPNPEDSVQGRKKKISRDHVERFG